MLCATKARFIRWSQTIFWNIEVCSFHLGPHTQIYDGGPSLEGDSGSSSAIKADSSTPFIAIVFEVSDPGELLDLYTQHHTHPLTQKSSLNSYKKKSLSSKMQFNTFTKLFVVCVVATSSVSASVLAARAPQVEDCVAVNLLCTNLGTLTCCPGLRCNTDVSVGGIDGGVSERQLAFLIHADNTTMLSFSSASQLEFVFTLYLVRDSYITLVAIEV